MSLRRTALTLALLWSAFLAGCGSSSTATGGNTNATCPTSGSATSTGSGSVSIGSKGFAEEQLLATMTQLVLQKHGFNVTYTYQAADPTLGQALKSGTIDMYWQYTGTALQGPLGVTSPPGDLHEAYLLAKQKDEANGVCWNAEGKFNDTNGLAAKSENKSKYGATLTELAAYLKNNPNTKVCVNSEFLTRPDGTPGLNKTYGNYFSGPGLVGSSQSTFEKAIASGQCEVGEVFTTDSAIGANNLYTFEDDKKFFPPDNVGLLVRSEVQKAHPQIGAIMEPVIAKLDNTTMIDLNRQVEIDNKKVVDVARSWLTQNGFL